MTNLKQHLERLVGQHYGNPRGIKGAIAGYLMLNQHQPENAWTISLLNVQPTDRLLEIGFGPGLAISHATKKLTSGCIYGIDISEAMVGLARRRNAQAVRQGRVKLQVGDAGNLPFAEGVFDKVLSIHSLYFWPDPARGVSEIRRVLKAGGICILTLMPSDLWPGADPENDGRYTEKHILGWMREGGFAEVRIERLEGNFVAAIGVK
jgi:ubiquinone/menaquinone biosynthesis C-methylase UbiE